MAGGRDARRAQRVRRAVERLSLRARLLIGLLVVAMAGLVVGNVVVYQKIESYLLGQVDSQLTNSFNQLANAISLRGGNVDAIRDFEFSGNTEPGTYGALLSASDQVLINPLSTPQDSNPAPAYPAGLVAAVAHESQSAAPTFFSTGAVGDASFTYRVMATPVELNETNSAGAVVSETAVLTVAYPEVQLNGTLHQLVLIDVLVGLALLLVLAALGVLVVRVGLRPLAEIETTAGAIAAGDLSRRVELEDERTEVGRLGASLNVMLETIEHSFEEQRHAEERLRQFLADASHELRTPVTSIRGYAELFRRGAAERPEDLATAMRRIEEESIRMGGLVDDLLLLARLDQGRPFELEAVDLAEVVADVATDAQAIAPDRPVVLDAPDPLVVRGDGQRLRQVVANLVQNALRYTPVDARVTISAHRAGEAAEVRVADEGPGIAPEHLPHLFERFYRADPSRTRDSGGTGLGLAIVASIVEAHGGSVRVESTLGAGSVFIVQLPLAPAGERPPAAAAPTLRSPAFGATTPVPGGDEAALPQEPAGEPQLPVVTRQNASPSRDALGGPSVASNHASTAFDPGPNGA